LVGLQPDVILTNTTAPIVALQRVVAVIACPGSQAEGKRYHDWDGCIERITQLDPWPDVRTGS
jgi:hypothetical protein